MLSEATTPYWIASTDLDEISKVVSNAIEDTTLDNISRRETLHNIQSEISVSKTRNETAIFPPGHIATLLDLPLNATPVRFSHEEVTLLKSLNLSEGVIERLS